MESDQLSAFKERQRAMWSSFAPMATFTTPVAAHLVRFAEVAPGEAVLDIGMGTGVVAITAARTGARVSGLDLTPELLAHAHENARIAGVTEIDLIEGDAEDLPYPDAAFDVVLSQFGHMFAPRPERVVAEMRRVLKPSGRVAFATWPPELLVGKVFALVGRHSPPLPPGVPPPVLWGDRDVIAQRLTPAFGEFVFERGVMMVPALSVAHYRAYMEKNIGPMQKLIETMAGRPEDLEALRREFESMAEPFHHGNAMQQEYLFTRASAR